MATSITILQNTFKTLLFSFQNSFKYFTIIIPNLYFLIILIIFFNYLLI